jgi:hypothetical protein
MWQEPENATILLKDFIRSTWLGMDDAAAHLLLYQTAGGRNIEIVRILHDRMDLRRHLPFLPENDKM